MRNNSVSMSIVLVILLTFGMACQALKSKEITSEEIKKDNQPAGNITTEKTETTKNPDQKTKTRQPGGIISLDDKPDFIVQAEDLVKAKKEAPNPIKPPEKYRGKIIEVTGRVSYLYPEKVKTLAPRVNLRGGEPILDDFSCEFDEENKAEITTLKKDQLVTLRGLVPDLWLLHPSLQHCIIVEAK